jgi:hypothetical protein
LPWEVRAILQGAGRAMRLPPPGVAKPHGLFVLPVFMARQGDDGNNELEVAWDEYTHRRAEQYRKAHAPETYRVTEPAQQPAPKPAAKLAPGPPGKKRRKRTWSAEAEKLFEQNAHVASVVHAFSSAPVGFLLAGQAGRRFGALQRPAELEVLAFGGDDAEAAAVTELFDKVGYFTATEDDHGSKCFATALQKHTILLNGGARPKEGEAGTPETRAAAALGEYRSAYWNGGLSEWKCEYLDRHLAFDWRCAAPDRWPPWECGQQGERPPRRLLFRPFRFAVLSSVFLFAPGGTLRMTRNSWLTWRPSSARWRSIAGTSATASWRRSSRSGRAG